MRNMEIWSLIHEEPVIPRPKIVVFDLDACLWYPEVDTMSGGPFHVDEKPHTVRDRRGGKLALFEGVATVLKLLHSHPEWEDVEVGYASRTHCVEDAKECLKVMRVCHTDNITMHDVAQHLQIFPDRKTKHFEAIREASGVAFHDMLFFDNEFRNVADVSALGVCCAYVPDGLSLAGWESGLAQFAEGYAAGKHADFSKDHRRGWWY